MVPWGDRDLGHASSIISSSDRSLARHRVWITSADTIRKGRSEVNIHAVPEVEKSIKWMPTPERYLPSLLNHIQLGRMFFPLMTCVTGIRSDHKLCQSLHSRSSILHWVLGRRNRQGKTHLRLLQRWRYTRVFCCCLPHMAQ